MSSDFILVKGARQNNLKGLNLRLPLGELIVVTGVSGSGKSSLAFDTIYSEGQRRYVETFSPYARQFLDRMDKPQTDRIEGIPPAIAIDQTNPVRTSRSTVGTMTELNDHIKLLFARAARLHCRGCGKPVRRDSPESIYARLLDETRSLRRDTTTTPRLMVTFHVSIPENFTEKEITGFLNRQGYTRIHKRERRRLEVIQDRVRFNSAQRGRIVEALEAALERGRGNVVVHLLDEENTPCKSWQFSSDYRCPDCDIHYREPTPSTFSFNSPIGACESCRGFGRTMGIDYSLVVPDESRTLADGAVKPWQTKSYRECQRDLLRYAGRRGVPVDVPWRRLSKAHRRWVLEGDNDGRWYGVKGFFDWLETKSYRMHIRVLLSRYRSYVPCALCVGSRLKPEALDWRVGSRQDADSALGTAQRFRSPLSTLSAKAHAALPGLSVHDVMLLPLGGCAEFFAELSLEKPLDEASGLLLEEIRSRLRYLVEVGLGYLTLDRQSRTLSGGEVQRINLTTALGTSLVNTLFVLDEPSIGLHARDMQRVIGVLHRLRDAGNSLIVVEHDEQIMRAADKVLDLGPGPGERGGRVVFYGSPEALARSERSLTAQYLSGKKRIAPARAKAARGTPDAEQHLEIVGATEHNLKSIDVRIPLNRFVCVTGVSGSGKSTLVEDILYRGLRKLKGRPVDAPGEHRAIRGHELIEDVMLVDQSPIGKTTRSNPASYVGALDTIRKLFANEPLARERGYTAGTFSFNSGTGRCPTCGGNGFEHVEMQFLSDVYLRCPECDGRRYRPEILEVKLASGARSAGRSRERAKSMADVLDMTVAQALAFFADQPKVLDALEPLLAVGLDYMKLGQPVPTLSGGEAQRLKLAGHLAKASTGAKLLLFDEPTTGLHFDDVATLIAAFERLLADGHSLIVIEHNLDVIAACDWIIDLGPEGGDAGGELVCQGRPREVAGVKGSLTGTALRAKTRAGGTRPARANGRSRRVAVAGAPDAIEVRNAREHNLKSIDIKIPRGRFTVITGISGSGKSTVAFDILFAEGQRRYLESLNAYARQFVQPTARPDVDAIFGIPPTVAIEQRTSRGGRKSTVATMTEIYHFLRLLFVKLGIQHCPECDIPIESQSREAIVAGIMRAFRSRKITLLAPLIVARKGYYTDLAKWAAAKGYASLRVDGVDTPTSPWPRLDRFKEHHIDLPVGDVLVSAKTEKALAALVDKALDLGKGMVRVARTATPRSTATERIYSIKRACPSCERSFPDLDPRLFSFNSQHGWCPQCFGTGLELEGFDAEQTGEESWWTEEAEGGDTVCSACGGRRLCPEALAVRFKGHDIAGVTAMTVDANEALFSRLRLAGREAQIARDILAELRSRLAFLKQVGLGYLSLDRSAPSLSGGEAQRIRLASQLGSNLRGVCYILDEPTIGLHVRDTRMLLKTLARLENKGNTIVVVEHDEDTIRHAEHVIDLGPGAGVNGGRVVAQGTFDEIMANPRSVTGRFLATPLPHPLNGASRTQARDGVLEIVGARLHNLRGVRAKLPLGRLICVTGVSGSGKSTLIRDILHDNLKRLLEGRRKSRGRRAKATLIGCDEMRGSEAIGRVLEVDQTPIGKTPRSCPATYVGFWDSIRRLFADTGEARIRAYGPGRFSFNVHGGRCSACEGQGVKKIEMSFLPDVRVPCDACGGARFGEETLAVHYRDKSIADVLAMSIDEASGFFTAHPAIHRSLALLREVGLGYLTLGQQSPTLSGGEAQRIKLVTELAKASPTDAPDGRARRGNGARTLYVLDEPTIGLHMADVEKLIGVLHRLVDAGNTVVVIEHNLDVIAEADWLIDMGPEGGKAGGRIVAQGPPSEVARKRSSHTGRALATFLRQRKPRAKRGSSEKGRALVDRRRQKKGAAISPPLLPSSRRTSS
ncbi:MAG: excinuclease ABC subunit UvrA [Gammaproteobacteria bacterium]|nr:excinuclease ABC subunit UvrA [Gammaproteobacteria bacterium]NIP87525.1 excinuclease ABC subunit UvrA [Gammaproteobacteria bacterium]NIR21870.1 excinuclease ABC subunit UvrA [Gammaproteobacteria bacterium]NIS03570.1 excinuclease ABC subunit UvrA [Gammaproteobacteria bacterium]NIU40318.1 excinuclease ABC subunit UvrA [Gammaproteobacteria bacterium]